MKTLALLIIAIGLIGCDNAPMQDRMTRDYKMECTKDLAAADDAPINIFRCENTEILCYSTYHGMACKFKAQ